MIEIRDGKSFYIMFNVADGGIVETIDFDKNNLTIDKSIIVMDEEKQRLWLWHGKKRGLVARRTALRQAPSLKGHGYQAGNAIIGRDLNNIVEIDDRKVDRESTTTKNYEDFLKLFNFKFNHLGHNVYSKGVESDVPLESKQNQKQKQKQNQKQNQKQKPNQQQKMEDESTVLASQNENIPLKAPKLNLKPLNKEIEDKKQKVGLLNIPEEDIKKGAVLLAIIEEYKDIWVSKKEDGYFNLEQMDGKICSFMIKDGIVRFKPGSFNEVPSEKKAAIMKKIDKLN